MRQSYFPSTDAALLAWARNISNRISTDYGAYGIDQQRAEEFADVVAGYADAYALAVDPSTRTKPNVSRKTDAREAMKDAARRIVSIVRGQPDVTDAQKTELGITVPAPRRAAVPRPQHPPRLSVRSVTEHTVHLRLADSQLIAGSAKPPGVRAALIFVAIGDEPPERGSAGWRYYASTGRLAFDVSFPLHLAPGTKVWTCAAWVNSRNQPGPACSAVGTLLQFGANIQFGESMGLAA